MKQRWAVLILLLAGIVAYANTAKNGLFWDDDEFITKNAYIRSFRYLPQWFSQPMTAGAGVNSNYYRPLLQLSFAIDYKLWGLWPAGYHLENLLWHSLAGILLFVFLNNFLSQIFNFPARNATCPKCFAYRSRRAHSVVGGQFSCPQSLRDSVCRRAIFNQFSKSKQLIINNLPADQRAMSRERIVPEGEWQAQASQQLTMIAFAASLLWLIHPVHVEAVAYANSRGDSMAAVFILLTLILWMPPFGWSPVRVKKRFRASAIAFILALLSKEFAIVTPGLILLVESLRGGMYQTVRPDAANPRALEVWKFRKLPNITNLASKKLYRLLTIVVNLYNSMKPAILHITIAIIYLTLRLTVLNFQNTLNFYGISPQRSNLCAQRLDLCNPFELYAASLPVRLLTFLKVLPIYGRILVWPDDLHMERTVEIATTIKDPIVLSSLAVILASAGFFGWALIFSSRKLAGTSEPRTRAAPRTPRGTGALATPANICEVVAGEQVNVVRGKLLLFSSGWFFISILPVSGLIPISQILAEHFLYLPGIGFFLVFNWLIILGLNQISRLLKIGRLNDSNHLTLIYLSHWMILLGISIPLITKTVSQNRIWRDPITFYEYTLAHAQPTARVYNNLAMAYADRGDHQKAIANYQLAIGLGDVYPNPHYNLGNTFVELGKLDEAETEYKRALELNPSFHYATLKLGQIYLNQGKIDAAKNLVCPVFPAQPLCQQL